MEGRDGRYSGKILATYSFLPLFACVGDLGLLFMRMMMGRFSGIGAYDLHLLKSGW